MSKEPTPPAGPQLPPRQAAATGGRADARHAGGRAEQRVAAAPRLQMQRAEANYNAGRREEALQEMRDLHQRAPHNRHVRTRLAAWLVQQGHYGEAFELLSGLADRPQAGKAELRLWMAAGLYTRRHAEIAARQQAIVHGAAGDAGRVTVAMLALASVGAVPAPPTPETPVELSADALDDVRQYAGSLLDSGQAAASHAFVASVHALHPQEGALASALLFTRFVGKEIPDIEQAQQQLRGDLVIDERDINRFADILAITGAGHEHHDVMLKALERIPDPAARARRAMDLVELLHSRNDIARARAVLAQIDPGGLKQHAQWRIRRLAEVLQLPLPAELRTPGLIEPDDVFEDGIIRHYRFGNERCMIWFGGVSPSGEARRHQSWLPVWAKLGVSVLTIHDHRRFAGLGGFGRYFQDRPAAERALRALVSQLGYVQFVTSGSSLAGASALLYAARLQATGVLLFGGLTHLPGVDEIAANYGMLILHRLRNELAIDFDDALPLLDAHPNPDMVVHQHYGMQSALDNAQALHIAHLPNVVSFAAQHDMHDALAWLQSQGQLEDAIRRFIADLPALPARDETAG